MLLQLELMKLKKKIKKMSNNIKTIGEQIRIARLTKKTTQKELAEKSGLSAFTILNIEKGNANPSYTNLEAIATALNCELEIKFKTK